MNTYRRQMFRRSLALLLLAALIGLAACNSSPPAQTQQKGSGQFTPVASAGTTNASLPSSETRTPGANAPWPVISRDAPAFASSTYYPASNADDASYDTLWRSNGAPAWLAYDLSSVPASERQNVLIVWYNESYNYDHTIINYPTYNMPEDYTIDVNTAPGGDSPPTSGWTTRVTVKGNHYHSRQHLINMGGANWIRISVTRIDGSSENFDASLNMDVYDASYALTDDWIFYGDSITAGGMGHSAIGDIPSFSQMINAKVPGHFPVQEAGGIGYLSSADAVKYIHTWLPLFPGKYVGISYGTNDALACINPATFYSNYTALVQAVLAAGKTPVIPLIPWGKNTNIQQCAPSLNAMIKTLYSAFPQIIKGPDFWSFFQSHQNLISTDDVHPTDPGFGAYRQLWANTMLTEVYHK